MGNQISIPRDTNPSAKHGSAIPTSIEDTIAIVKALLDEKRFQEARSYIQQAREQVPKEYRGRYYFWEGYIIKELGSLQEAISCFDRAIALSPHLIKPHIEKATCLNRLQKFKDAKSAVAKAYEMDDSNPQVWNCKGEIASQEGLLEDALIDFNEAIKLDEQWAVPYCNKGDCLRKQGRFYEALEALDWALGIDSALDYAYFVRGRILLAQEKYSGAVAFCVKAISINPKNATYYYQKAQALKNLDKLHEAIQALEQAMEVQPDYQEARDLQIACMSERIRAFGEPSATTTRLPARPPLWAGLQRKLSVLRQAGFDVDNQDVPHDYVCPINCCIMEDPAMDNKGHNYEHDAIQQWYEASRVSPMTGIQMDDTTLTRNRVLRDQISQWVDQMLDQYCSDEVTD